MDGASATSTTSFLGPGPSSGDDPQIYGRQINEYEPGVMNWILAMVLCAGLICGLVHVYRVLRGGGAIRNVPEGFRPVECGACHTTQYVQTHGRIFVCYSCHSANRIPIEFPRIQEMELVEASGPLRKYEFKKGGVNFWQELRREQADESCAGDCAALLLGGASPAQALARGQPGPLPGSTTPGSAGGDPGSPLGGGGTIAVLPAQAAQEVGQPMVTPTAAALPPWAAQVTPGVTPCVVGRQAFVSNDDDEVISCITADDVSGLPQCVVCLDKLGCMVLLPCAHGSVCEECVTRIVQNRASGGAHCPHCRSNIQILVKILEMDGEVAKGLELRIPMARPL